MFLTTLRTIAGIQMAVILRVFFKNPVQSKPARVAPGAE
jgi:hypothetical protein